MNGILKVLLVCLIAIVMILPIGIGALVGFNNSNDDQVGSSQNQDIDVNVSLSETEIGCNIGATKVLTATPDVESDSYIFQWSSDNKEVVSVKRDAESDRSCIVTAESEGTAVVTVNVIEKTRFVIVASATCQVTVVDSNIQFGVPEVIISLDKGNTFTLNAKAPDNGEITWSSEDESIATVEAGVITAHKPGSVYIVAHSGNVEGKLLVKIYESVFTLESYKQLAVGGTTGIEVDGTIPTGAVWTSSDDRIATVDQNGVVTAVKPGMVTIKVSSTTDDLTSTCVVIVKGTGAEAFELASGKKAEAAANPGNWYYLCESNIVTVGSVPTMDNGLINLDITNVGASGANMFYLRYQVDEVGDVTYKHTLYIYSENDNVLIQLNGKDTYLNAGLNRIEVEYISAPKKDNNPYQIKFKSAGKFFVLPVFEEVSRVEKMVLSESAYALNTGAENTVTLVATVPGQSTPNVVWTSSNESVCTVVDGVVTAVGAGNAVITAKCGDFSAICLIMVTGETAIEGDTLSSGNKSATVADPGNWFYLADGKSKVYTTPVMDSDGDIHMAITNIDTNDKKFVYLRYQPEDVGVKYKVIVTIDFAGMDGTVVDLTGGDVTSAVSKTLNNGVNTFEFEFTSTSKDPLQMKFFGIGAYVVNVTIVEA